MKLLNCLFLTCAIFLSTAVFADNSEKEAYAQLSSSSVQISPLNSVVFLENQDHLSGIKVLNDAQFKIKEKGPSLIMVSDRVGSQGFLRA
ncbi:MAG TPA: hypothetical protein PLC42_04790 [Parachlamydiaceae bacterium]|nr:hypothetical protein [Parachlamydiaceae bacterium]